ncbi:hypothetical protein [Azovibrio restrictus]|uniref:hypothetical protein n=1 Tax=Azovibrio restrictus TaxID=146938 RepID=UPI0026EDF9E0|nr:hypothetical protein [Azovibrio restrictus]
MSNRQSRFPWRRFLRRRFPAHAEGWVYAQIPLWWLALLLDPAPGATVDALYAVLALPVAVGMVGALVLLAALLRFPWWLLLPLCLASMGAEALWRKLARRPWRPEAVRCRWYLSNAVAVWQYWELKNRRWQRRLSRHTAKSFASFRAATALHRPARPRPANVLRLPPPPDSGLMDYISTVLGAHALFWFAVSFVGAWVYFAADEQLDWLLAFIMATILFIAGSVFLVLPVVLGTVAFVSALIVGLMRSPIERARTVRALQPPTPKAVEHDQSPAKQSSNWLLPLALGLLIGSAWGTEE